MLILIGPSASGKTEVAKLLASKYNYMFGDPYINDKKWAQVKTPEPILI